MSEVRSTQSNSQNNQKNDHMATEEVDQEFEAMRQRIKEMEEEAQRLKEMQAQVEKELNLTSNEQPDSKDDVDSRSIYIGNVEYSTLPQELQAHFQTCGVINRVTILCDKWTGHPKGYAYVEFSDPSIVQNALALNESLFKGRIIKVCAKRKNVPGLSRGRAGRRNAPVRNPYRPGYQYRGAPPPPFYSSGNRPHRSFYAPY